MEVCVNGIWATVCSKNSAEMSLTSTESDLVCRQLFGNSIGKLSIVVP